MGLARSIGRRMGKADDREEEQEEQEVRGGAEGTSQADARDGVAKAHGPGAQTYIQWGSEGLGRRRVISLGKGAPVFSAPYTSTSLTVYTNQCTDLATQLMQNRIWIHALPLPPTDL